MGEGGADLVAEGGVAGLVEAEEGFLEDGAGGFSHAEEFRERIGKFDTVAGFGVEADEFGEGGLVQRVEHGGAVEDGAGGGFGFEEAELFREEQRIGGAEVRLAEEGIQHELGAGGVFQSVEREAAETVERGGEVVVVFVFLAHRGDGEIEGGLVLLRAEEGLDAGEVEGVEGVAAFVGERGEAGGELGLDGVDGEPGEEDEGFGVGGKIFEVGGEFALFGG